MTTETTETSDIKKLLGKNFLEYASYVILDRAIPDALDGLKPVQRRILYTLFRMDDGKFQKVANVCGQTMYFHPHGDAPIYEALVNLANKEYLLDRQGNFGNAATGDPAAAARYIETRLSPLAKETLFNNDLTAFVPSYDGRNEEPVQLPSKLPLILLLGAEGIAVGMSTRILPHNFSEVLKAEIDLLDGKSISLLPDFSTGGIIDASDYDCGRGKVRLRAKIEIVNEKTLVIREICHGTTTESVISTIDEAAKKGKLKIESISDFTSDKVEIEIKLPRGQYAQDIIDALYAFTECEVSISTQCLVIRNQQPWETDVVSILSYHAESLQEFLKKELEIEQKSLLEKAFAKTLEQIFIENRIYMVIEKLKEWDKIIHAVENELKPHLAMLSRPLQTEDIETLLAIPIRRISKFDRDKNESEIKALQERLEEVLSFLKNVKKYTIGYLQNILKKHSKDFPRRTQIKSIEQVDKRQVATKQVSVGIDIKAGYVGLNVESQDSLSCTNFDKLLLLFSNGHYKVINIPEKEYVLSQENAKLVYAAVADKQTTIWVVYKTASKRCFAKAFVIKQFILEKDYEFLEPGCKLELLTTKKDAEIELEYVPKPRQKVSVERFLLKDISVKGVGAKGIRLADKEVHKCRLK